jgi:hypothetical protein
LLSTTKIVDLSLIIQSDSFPAVASTSLPVH